MACNCVLQPRESAYKGISHCGLGNAIGMGQNPGHVIKGKKMAGHMGNVRTTNENLEVIRVDTERNLLLVKGAVPGAKGADLMVRPAVKTK